jgi:hypothetical protein
MDMVRKWFDSQSARWKKTFYGFGRLGYQSTIFNEQIVNEGVTPTERDTVLSLLQRLVRQSSYFQWRLKMNGFVEWVQQRWTIAIPIAMVEKWVSSPKPYRFE